LWILALQETHLTEREEDELNIKFENDWKIISSIDPNHTNAAGVAFVLNKKLANTEGIIKQNMAAGRALQITIPWRKDIKLTLLNIYAPNNATENETFWNDLKNKIPDDKKPDVLLGDFNLVEDALDRLPAHRDHAGATTALSDLKAHLHLRDGWRHINPDTKNYTYSQVRPQGSIKSRLDRIYVVEHRLRYCREWPIDTPAIATDHRMVSVRLSDKKLPFIGRGRWIIPLFLIENKGMNIKIQKLGKTLESNIDIARTESCNPQTLFNDFKQELINECREEAKISKPKREKQLQDLDEKAKALYNDPDITNEEKQTKVNAILEQMNLIQQKFYEKLGDNRTAKIRLESESATSKAWAQSGKIRPPRDTIQELKIPDSNPPSFVKNSDKMAELARNYHETLQDKHLADAETKEKASVEILELLDAKISRQHKADLAKYLTYDEISNTIRYLPRGKAPGKDGIPNELWKDLWDKHQKTKDKSGDKKSFDITKVLTKVYNDIEKYGITPNSCFSEGWMCPIYKKGDKSEIANYRPITLLNTDYKILTKALTIRLANIAPTVIHENQAGFVLGRSIHDQTHLTQMIMNYTEVEEIGGIIVSLDQEKAYDKISHDYL
jgi:exonuclease III